MGTNLVVARGAAGLLLALLLGSWCCWFCWVGIVVLLDCAAGCCSYAVVTGANKGIGFSISKQLASNEIIVVVTARDEKRGLEAIQKLKELGLSDYVVFHQLDVTDYASISSLADFIKIQFGKLDILVNNAGIHGTNVDHEALEASVAAATFWKKRLGMPQSVSSGDSLTVTCQCKDNDVFGLVTGSWRF
ncbi:hypothetical protein RIF29_15621 [Crotalaria pallida]|uniref:(+)-neomenthol dehydrogenase-like n=1 Tax=Crotalaria pallida TaxID=3830 RepID=A0AAN9FKF4_CROPI